MTDSLIISILSILFILTTGGYFLYDQAKDRPEQIQSTLYSEQDVLESTWEQYKDHYLEKETGRTLDRQRDSITTSEGQSYTMLRSVWMDDKKTFDKAWRWTKDNLRKETYLFAWKFGERRDGTYGILEDDGGDTSATDGDTDIALALLLAYGRWGDEIYKSEAKEILDAVWEYEIIEIANKPYLLANDIEKSIQKADLIVNPSYFSPYAYRVFAYFDPQHNWYGVVDTSYDILNTSLSHPLDKEASTGLPPNWITINRFTGAIKAPTQENLTTNYGYDAMRIPWRIALDYQWFNDTRSKETLRKFSFLSTEWQKKQKLYAIYAHNGKPVSAVESISMYSGAIGYFKYIHPEQALEIHNEKIIKNYDLMRFQWFKDPGYYGDNWTWFGFALYHDRLFNYVDFLLEEDT